MKAKVHFSILIGSIAMLTSCSNYSYISENDVYMQAPTEINLEEDENDLTSFNAFKAREKGEFRDEYVDPLVSQRSRMNQFMIVNSYMPYGVSYSMFANQPIRFHGMGMYNPFYAGYGFTGPSFGYGFSSGFGMEMHYLRYGNSYYAGNYGYGYNPYGYNGYGYGYNPYYNSGGHSYGNPNYNSPQPAQPIHYGKRNTITSSSNRSSSYNNYKSKQAVPVSASSYDINDEKLGSSRREVSRRYAGSSDYSNNGEPNKSGMSTSPVGINTSVGVSRQRAANQSFTPSSSARRSGAVQTHSSTRVNSQRGVSSVPSQRTSPSSTQSRTQVQGQRSFSTSPSSSSRSVSPSSTSSSGSGSSSSRRR